MKRLNKTIRTTLFASLSAFALPTESFADSAITTLMIYAGPQSVVPNHPVYVTVEATDTNGQSANGKEVELSYKTGGTFVTVRGTTKQGLVSFKVAAEKIAGLIQFTAKAGLVRSNSATVLVTADRPQPFSLFTAATQQPRKIEIKTSLIADQYGNLISDITPVTFEWIDASGLKAKHISQPQNGRLSLTLNCPLSFTGALIIRASLQSLQIKSADISNLCTGKDG